MVIKARSRPTYTTTKVNGVTVGTYSTRSLWEQMADSSVTGSARTDVQAVDKFLADPTNRGDFHRALRESNKTAGDAGLAHFRVDRNKEEFSTGNLTLVGASPSFLTTNLEGFVIHPGFISGFPDLPPIPELNSSELRIAGQDLYHRALPNKDQADLGTMIGEIATNPVRALVIPGRALSRAVARQGRAERARRLLPARARDRHRQIQGLPLEAARVAADDYLAYIFGVRPNVGTLDDLAASLSASRRQAEIVQRDGNRRLRRGRALKPIYQVASSTHAGWNSPAGLTMWGLEGTVHRFVEAKQDTWFSGSFRMPVRDTETWLDRCNAFFHEIDRLTGLGLDARVSWDLIPFSFMVDWFSNTGDFLENRQIVANYNITCEYGYVMSHTQYLKTVTGAGTFRHTGRASQIAYYGTAPYSFTATRLEETKLRARTNAFGFYTDFDSLNPQQWAALTAIGLSNAAGIRPTVRT